MRGGGDGGLGRAGRQKREREPEDLSLDGRVRERGSGKNLSLDGREKARENWNFPPFNWVAQDSFGATRLPR